MTAEERNAYQRKHRKKTGNAETHRYEKTPKGFLMRSYRNMQNRVEGKCGPGSWVGQPILSRDEYYDWAFSDPDFVALYVEYSGSGFVQRLAPSPDRLDPSKGYTLDNLEWVPQWENSGRARRAV